MWMKRLASPKWWPIERKTKKFVAVPRGPHQKEYSLPLVILIRDVLKLAETGREARNIIKSGKVFVDGKARRDPNLGIGYLDVIEIPEIKKAWRVSPKNNFSLIEIDDPKYRICKIIDKKILKGNKTQLNLDCGKNILTEKKFSTKDSILIKLPEQTIENHLKFENGSLALVMRGKNIGKIAKIKKIELEKNRAILEAGKDGFEVPVDFITIVGREKPLIKLE
jgi:small subunit ribosomal protein S4e